MAFSDTRRWYNAMRVSAKFNDPSPEAREEAKKLTNWYTFLTHRQTALAEAVQTMQLWNHGDEPEDLSRFEDMDVAELETHYSALRGHVPDDSFGQPQGWDMEPLTREEKLAMVGLPQETRLVDSWGEGVEIKPDYSLARVNTPHVSSGMPPGWEGYETPDTYGLRAAEKARIAAGGQPATVAVRVGNTTWTSSKDIPCGPGGIPL